MEMNKLKDAIKMFQKKIEKQGRITNARDEEHLSNLIKLYIQMGGKGLKEVAPKGWEGTVKAMKKEKDIDNPYALAHWMKNKGYKSHKPE